MQIQLIQSEIEEALVAYIANQGIDLSDKTISVEMTAGRGGNGHTAQISIVKGEGASNVVSLSDSSNDEDESEDEDAKPLFGDTD